MKVETHIMKQFSKYDFWYILQQSENLITEFYSSVNNNILSIKAELLAILVTLLITTENSEIIIFTDNQTIVENYINLKGSINIK